MRGSEKGGSCREAKMSRPDFSTYSRAWSFFPWLSKSQYAVARSMRASNEGLGLSCERAVGRPCRVARAKRARQVGPHGFGLTARHEVLRNPIIPYSGINKSV